MPSGENSLRRDLNLVLVAGTAAMVGVTFVSIAHNFTSILAPLLQDAYWGSLPEAVRLPLLMTAASGMIIILCGLVVWSKASLRSEDRAHDLLYYLGFIGTLCGLLGASFALALGLDGSNGVNPVPMLVAQNGIALVTTLLGMFLRNVLSYSYAPSEPDLDAMLSNVSENARSAGQSVGELSERVKAYADAVTGFSQALGAASSSVRSDVPAWNDFSESAQTAKSAMSEASQSVSGVAGSVHQVGVEAYQMARHLSGVLRNLQAQMADVSTQLDVMRAASQPPAESGGWNLFGAESPRRRSAAR